MKNICKIMFKGVIQQKCGKLLLLEASSSSLHTGSLVLQYRIESKIWACEFYTHSSKIITLKLPTSTQAVYTGAFRF